MASQAVDLIAQSLCRDAVVLLRPFRIMFPVITAAPACEDEDAVAVCQVEEFVSIQLAFLANRIQIHVANVAKLIFQTLRGLAQHHVRRPASASNEKPFPVHFEKKGVLLVYFRSDFPNSKIRLQLIGNGIVDFEFQFKRVEVGYAHLRRPPEVWIAHAELRKDCWSKCYLFTFPWTKLDVSRKMDVFNTAFQSSFDRFLRCIFYIGTHREMCRF